MAPADRHADFLAALEGHRRILYKVARAYGRTAEDRDDLAQEVVVQLWRAYPRYDARWRFSTWMYRVALNVALSHRRRERTRERHLDPDGEPLLHALAGDDPAPSEAVERLYAAIGRLDDLNKALALLYLDGHSHAEMAEVLGITPTNVGTRIGRLKERLRRDLSEPAANDGAGNREAEG